MSSSPTLPVIARDASAGEPADAGGRREERPPAGSRRRQLPLQCFEAELGSHDAAACPSGRQRPGRARRRPGPVDLRLSPQDRDPRRGAGTSAGQLGGDLDEAGRQIGIDLADAGSQGVGRRRRHRAPCEVPGGVVDGQDGRGGHDQTHAAQFSPQVFPQPPPSAVETLRPGAPDGRQGHAAGHGGDHAIDRRRVGEAGLGRPRSGAVRAAIVDVHEHRHPEAHGHTDGGGTARVDDDLTHA
jgi:hypothetical protein